MDDLHDWSNYMIQVESTLKIINDKFLHKQYAGLDHLIQKVKDNLEKALMWSHEQHE